MYPIFRLAKEMVKFRNAPALPTEGVHVSHHICWPWDIDPWIELNNGRTLTLFDLGRLPLMHRLGLVQYGKSQNWGLTVAGVSMRYRRRVRAFDRLEMRSRLLGWDARFFYVEQSMWNRDGECTGSALIRVAVADSAGIVAPKKMAHGVGWDENSPALPDWCQAWIAADAQRPWPPTA